MNISRRRETRIARLEARFHSSPVILHFTDGSVREIPAQSARLLDLLLATWRGTLDSRQQVWVKWVGQCEYALSRAEGE